MGAELLVGTQRTTEATVNHPVVQVLALGNIAEFPRADRSDGELLNLFVHGRDEEAFAAVVRRHGPMVLAVCRRVLGNHADGAGPRIELQ